MSSLRIDGGMWYLDRRYSRHMIGDKRKFTSLELKSREKVTLEDNIICKVRLPCTIIIKNSLSIKKVLIDGFKYIFFRISQLCDKGFNDKFLNDKCLLI